MLGQNGRRIVAALVIVALMALVMAACGGGEEETTTTTKLGTVTTLPPAGSGSQNPLVDTPVVPTDDTPVTFTDVFETQPLVVFFYTPGGKDDETVYANLKQVEPSFGAYSFFYYKYGESDAYGDLSLLLQVDYTPTMVLIDRTGVVRRVWTGFVDAGSLNQSLVNLGRD